VVRPIAKLLVANRGEIARRIMRTARSLAMATVAVYSDPDAGAPFVVEADEAVRLPGSTPSETYLDIEAVVAAAAASGADGVHPGYGFLSENAAFARACATAGLVFVGPSPEVIEAMGSKLAAKELMAAAGVPVLPGAAVTSAEDARAVAAEIGWPVLVKAAFGGGGRGMRVVTSDGEMAEAVSSAQREAGAAFGDPTVFLERFVTSPRHIEVQILGDTTGQVVHLFERECSIQRRYQKIIEECPSPVVTEALRAELGQAAVTAARALGYVGAGTVEFVMDGDGRFYFLEVNTRLQVEHPVTEEVTGIDLVAVQLAVAAGRPLPDAVHRARIQGHAIEARLYAEDVAAGYLPVSGTLHTVDLPAGAGVRVDSGVEDGSVVSTYYDAMLAKVIGVGPTRELAAGRLADALARARIHGPVTNRDLLVGVLRHPEFLAGATDTGFLARHDPGRLSRTDPDGRVRRLHAVAAALAGQADRRARAPVQPSLPSGWRNVDSAPQRVELADDAGPLAVAYRVHRRPVGSATTPAELTVDGEPVEPVVLGQVTADLVELTVDGVRRRVTVARHGTTHYVDSPLGSSVFTEADRFPLPHVDEAAGSLIAPMPGAIARVECQVGQPVTTGQVLVVLEAMKMEHAIRCPHDGTVAEVRVAPGVQVETGAVLVVVAAPGTDPTGSPTGGPGATGAARTGEVGDG
jgi:acetyl/propionyl-CoA carboxylase alpha subunit